MNQPAVTRVEVGRGRLVAQRNAAAVAGVDHAVAERLRAQLVSVHVRHDGNVRNLAGPQPIDGVCERRARNESKPAMAVGFVGSSSWLTSPLMLGAVPFPLMILVVERVRQRHRRMGT